MTNHISHAASHTHAVRIVHVKIISKFVWGGWGGVPGEGLVEKDGGGNKPTSVSNVNREKMKMYGIIKRL